MNILVLCTRSPARSILLEFPLNAHGARHWWAYFVRSQPGGWVHPHAMLLLCRQNHDGGELSSKIWNEFAKPDAPVMDLMITICGAAATQTCPIWSGAPIRAHCGINDPAAAPQTNSGSAVQSVSDLLSRRTLDFMEIPLQTMQAIDLKYAVAKIGTIP